MPDTTIKQSQLQQALAKIEAEVVAGVQHGFFELTVSGEMINQQKRRILVRSGRSFSFCISPEELSQ